jgi:nucleotide-binding universal stress UspA family protein
MAKAPLFVVPVDFAPEMEATVSAAFALAEKCGADVDLLKVIASRAPSLLEHQAVKRAGKRPSSTRDWSRLTAPITAAERSRIRVRTVAYRGDATKIILSYAQLTRAKLLIVDRHYGTSRWRRTTRIVSALCRAAPAPVLVFPPQRRVENARSRSFGRIVSAVDLTVASAMAVRTVLDLIRRTGARLTLVHAVKNFPRHMVFSGGEALRVTRNLSGDSARIAEQLRRKIPADLDVRVDVRVITGEPQRGVLDIAAEVNADLIVMGVATRARIEERLFGSTLRAILRRAAIPVLVLPIVAGSHKWLEDTDRVESPDRRKTPPKARQRLAPS